MYGVVLVLTLIVTGGVIAYIGDKIGMKIGRKKLSLFGLRPKYTSILVTIITGFVIAAASILVLTIVSEDVRQALFEYEEIKEALAVSERRYQEAEQRVQEAEQRVEELASQIEEKTRLVDELNAELQAVEAEKEAAKKELEAVKAELVTVRADYEQAKAELGTTREKLAETNELLAAKEKRVADLEDIAQRLQKTIEELRARERDLYKSVEELGDRVAEMWATMNKMKSGNFAYEANEIILARVFPGGMPEEQARKELLDFLEEADRVALRHGAQDENSDTALRFQSEQVFYQAAKVIANSQEKVIVRVRSLYNSVIGEPVRVYFELHKNELIYRRGEEIVSLEIEGGKANADAQIYQLLAEVNGTLIEKGMITESDGTVGKVIEGDQFLTVLSEIRNHDGRLRITVKAADNIWRAEGPPKVTLEVVPVNDG